MRIKVGITIDATPGRVWLEIEDITRHVEWMADAVSVELASSQRSGVGTTFSCLTKVGPFRLRDEMRVTEWTPRHAMGIEHRGAVVGVGRFTLARRRGGRTRFVWKERLRFPLWMGGPIGAWCAKPVLRHIWKRNLLRLKAQCEAT